MCHQPCWCVCGVAGPSLLSSVLSVHWLWHKPETEGPFLCGGSNLLWKARPRAGHPTWRLRCGHCVPQVNQHTCSEPSSPPSPCCCLFSQCSGPLLSQKFLLTLVLSLLIKPASPPLLTDCHCCVMPAFIAHGRLSCPLSPCQHLSAFSSPRFIFTANGRPNWNWNEFDIRVNKFIDSRAVWCPFSFGHVPYFLSQARWDFWNLSSCFGFPTSLRFAGPSLQVWEMWHLNEPVLAFLWSLLQIIFVPFVLLQDPRCFSAFSLFSAK